MQSDITSPTRAGELHSALIWFAFSFDAPVLFGPPGLESAAAAAPEGSICRVNIVVMKLCRVTLQAAWQSGFHCGKRGTLQKFGKY